MASYVSPNYNPGYYELPVFEAPIDLAFRVAQQKQAQFDNGLEQVKRAYQSNLNLPVESEIGIAKRDAFMKEADQKLRKIASADFSMQENVNAAYNIYKPITEDKDILNDLYKSSYYKKGMSELQSYKTRKLGSDEKYIDPYYSERYLMEGYQQFKSSKTSDDLANAEVRQFVRPVDFIGEWNKLAKDLDLGKDGAQLYMTPAGVYMYKEKNGKKAVPGLLNLANSQLSPEARNYMNTIGKVVFGDEVKRLAATHYNGDEIQAREHLSKQMMDEARNNYSDYLNEANALLKEREERLEQMKKQGMTSPNGQVDEQFKAVYKGLQSEIADLKSQKDKLAQKRDELDFKSDYGRSIGSSGKTKYQEALDTYLRSPEQYFSSNLISSYTKAWAEGIAKSTYQFTIDENKGYINSKNAETELLKAQADLAKATASKSSKSDDGDQTAPAETEGPIYLGQNTTQENVQDKYDRYQATLKTLSNQQVTGTLRLAERVFDRTPGFSSMLKKVEENVNSGQGANGISGSNPLSKEEQDALTALEQQGLKIPDGRYTYENVYNAIKGFTLDKAKEKVNSGDLNALDFLTRAGEIQDRDATLQKFNEDNKRIQSDVLSLPKFKEIRKADGSLMSKEEYINLYTKVAPDQNLDKLGLETRPNKGIKKPKGVTLEEGFGEKYDKLKNEFNKEFTNYIKDSKQKFNILSYEGNDVRIGIQYPVAGVRFDNKGTNDAENLVVQMFNDANISREENYSPRNLEQLGMTFDQLREVLGAFKANASELKQDDGIIEMVAVGSDNRRPEYRFKPSASFLEKVKKTMFLTDEQISKLGNYGISINNNMVNSEFERNLLSDISLYEPVINKNNGILNLDDFIDDDNFGAKVLKNMDGTYTFEIKYIGPDGQKRPPYVKTFDISKLDLAVKEARKSLYANYIEYKKRTNSPKNLTMTEEQFNAQMQ